MRFEPKAADFAVLKTVSLRCHCLAIKKIGAHIDIASIPKNSAAISGCARKDQ
jgi:hypothetical protein